MLLKNEIDVKLIKNFELNCDFGFYLGLCDSSVLF